MLENWYNARRAVTAALAMVVLAATAGCGPDMHGVSSTAPLGTLAAYDATLRPKMQQVVDVPQEKVARQGELHEEVAFAAELKGTRFEDAGEWVMTFTDQKGNVKAVVAQFRSQSAGFSTIGRTMDNFVSSLYLTFAKGEPKFEKQHFNDFDDSQYLLAKFGTATRGGKWRKEAAGGNLALTKTISDVVVLWAK